MAQISLSELVPPIVPHPSANIQNAAPSGDGMKNGADDETRTRDPHLGKVMRYQLRYIRKKVTRQ